MYRLCLTAFLIAVAFFTCISMTKSAKKQPDRPTDNNMTRFYCSSCVFNTPILKSFITHCNRIHGSEKNFRIYCSVKQCPYSARNVRLFCLHMKRNHPNERDDPSEFSSDEDQDEYPDGTLSIQDRQNYLAAKFSISLETEHKLSQQGTDEVIHSTKLLFDEKFSLFKTKLAEKMRTRGMATDVLDDVSNPDILCHLSSQNSRNAFYSGRMNLIQPRDVLLYRAFTLRKGVKNHLGYSIPFAENLKSLLSLPEIWRETGNSHKSRDRYMHDICDGDFVKNTEIFNAHPHALQILLYTDDIEIVNPIGSHTSKHKLTMFYFTLANILFTPLVPSSNISVVQDWYFSFQFFLTGFYISAISVRTVLCDILLSL